MKTPKITPIEIKPGAPTPFLALSIHGTLMVVEDVMSYDNESEPDKPLLQLSGTHIRSGTGELRKTPGSGTSTGIIIPESWIGFTVEPACEVFDPPILEKPYSTHPDDAFLSVVLHRNFKGEWVTHVRNTQDNGFSHGHYFDDLAEAATDFNKRGIQPEPSTI